MGKGANRDREFVWWYSKFIYMLGFPVRSKVGGGGLRILETLKEDVY